MKRLIVLGAMLASLAGVARAEDPRPAVFVRVDAVRVEKDHLVVAGLLEGGAKSSEWRGDFRDLGNAAASALRLRLCLDLAMRALESQGALRLEVSQPERWYPTCGIVRAPAAQAATAP